jgi:hypothetical protein
MDGVTWTVLSEHNQDEKLGEPRSTASWVMTSPPEETVGWRHIRIQQGDTTRLSSLVFHFI